MVCVVDIDQGFEYVFWRYIISVYVGCSCVWNIAALSCSYDIPMCNIIMISQRIGHVHCDSHNKI